MFTKRKTIPLLLAGLVLSLACNTVGTLVSGITGGGKIPRMKPDRLSAGWSHACAITDAGKVNCWGINDIGQLGDGTTENRSVPVEVAGLPGGIKAVAAGFTHSCALTDGGGVKCWGNNEFGELGDGSYTSSLGPVDVMGLQAGVKAIAAGGSTTCALLTGGTMKCWGANENGQLGHGGDQNVNIPVTVKDLSEEVTAMDIGVASHACAVLKSGKMMCWGANDFGKLGNRSTKPSKWPLNVEGVTNAAAVAIGYNHTCILQKDGTGFCWGENTTGQLGDGTTSSADAPTAIERIPEQPLSLDAGGGHTCVLSYEGEVSCWGWNEWGQIGDGTFSNHTVLFAVPMAGKAVEIAAGGNFTCALMEDGSVSCWGGNEFGQLGDGTMENRNTPVPVLNLPAA